MKEQFQRLSPVPLYSSICIWNRILSSVRAFFLLISIHFYD